LVNLYGDILFFIGVNILFLIYGFDL